jgi:hypothetical protein
VTDALLHHPPRDFGDRPISERLKAAIRRLLEKDREKRYPSAEALRADLVSMAEPAAGRAPVRTAWKAAAAALFIALAALAGWLWHRSSRARWVQATAIPEITRLVAAEDFQKAAAMMKEAPDAREALAPIDDRGFR